MPRSGNVGFELMMDGVRGFKQQQLHTNTQTGIASKQQTAFFLLSSFFVYAKLQDSIEVGSG
jgi:hypothetical protein